MKSWRIALIIVGIVLCCITRSLVRQNESVQRFTEGLGERDSEGRTFSRSVASSVTQRIPVDQAGSTPHLPNLNPRAAGFERPPLDTILNATNELDIVGDPSWLLDFAIIGYGKCGTSTMMHWLRGHPEIQAFGKEMGELMAEKPGRLIRKLYKELEAGPYYRGYKAPRDVSQRHILNYYRTYWPHAKLFLGIRHPVWWFQSLYNFRVQNLPARQTMPHPNKLIGRCTKDTFKTCTNKGDFALTMFLLGQQNHDPTVSRPTSLLERSILARYQKLRHWNLTKIEYMSNPIFLFDLTQMEDDNVARNDQFRHDVTKFMGLAETLPALPHYTPGRTQTDEEQLRRDAMKIDICDDEFEILRKHLMRMSKTTARWIREVFVQSPTVFVSSPDYFHTIMERWMVDPCKTAKLQSTV